MTKKSTCFGLIFSILMTGLIFILGFDRNTFEDYPIELYQVYLNGEVIGVIEDKTELYSLINKEQSSLKKEYEVDNIYPPEELELVEVTTYEGKTETAKEIYEKIKDLDTFTIEGYEVTIKSGEEKEILYILNEKDLTEAIDNTIKAFVDEETLKAYRDNSQPEIANVGKKIEKIYIDEEITIQKTLVSSEQQIFTNAKDLSKYILFGTLENQATYTIMQGDTIAEIAAKNNLNVNEFLIVNPEIVSEYALLFPGQVVNIGLIKPKVSVIVETTSTFIQEIPYETSVEYDNRMTIGTTYTKQQGINGESKATFWVKSLNGEDINAIRISAEEIKPAINQVVVKGGLSINYAGDSEYWGWPTGRPSVITSRYGWRRDPISGARSWHNGIDIVSSGHGAPIYSIQSGVVVGRGYSSSMGNYIYIDHQNGYHSVYMHLAFIADNISKGTTVLKGQTIGGMGSTGKSTGTHLHLSVWTNGYPYSSGATDINPQLLYD